MSIRKYNPTSPGRRFQTVQVFDEVTATEPYRPLTEPLRKSGGRNNHGELTSWWRGGSVSGLYGSVAVTSSNTWTVWNRRPGEVGLYLRMDMVV